MKYKQLIDNSTLVIHGCIQTTDFTEIEQRILLNHNVFSKFKNIVVYYNKDNDKIDDSYFDDLKNVYKKHFSNCIFISVFSESVSSGSVFFESVFYKKCICQNCIFCKCIF